jgi:hypothetical protein
MLVTGILRASVMGVHEQLSSGLAQANQVQVLTVATLGGLASVYYWQK